MSTGGPKGIQTWEWKRNKGLRRSDHRSLSLTVSLKQVYVASVSDSSYGSPLSSAYSARRATSLAPGRVGVQTQ